MAYRGLYQAEAEAHAKTKARLAIALDFAASFREYIQARNLHQDVLEFILTRHLGEAEAKRILGSDGQSEQK